MPFIHLKNNQQEYLFEFKQKYLFIRGDSGIGKSSLVNLVSDYNLNPDAIDCLGDSNITILNSEADLSKSDMIFFLDENNPLLYQSNSATMFNESNNYFIIISRSRNLDDLKTGLDSLVTMYVDDSNVHRIKLDYPSKQKIDDVGSCIVCEDSGSGMLFLLELLDKQIESAKSKNNIGRTLRKLGKDSYTIVYDRCGISFSYENQINYIQQKNIKVISELDWDSFESYILESKEYGASIPWFPDKENNATELFKQLIDADYDKSYLPDNMVRPIYGKVQDLCTICGKDMKLF